jgi:hypothetical protein
MPMQNYLAPEPQVVTRTLRAAAKLPPRWLRLVVMLTLLFALCSTNYLVSAQDDPDMKIHSYLKVSAPKEICVGEKATFTVTVVSDVRFTERDFLGAESGYDSIPVEQRGVKITAKVVSGDSVSLLWSDITTNIASNNFLVKGEKVGKSTLSFDAPLKKRPRETMDGPVGGSSVSNRASVEVVCQ